MRKPAKVSCTDPKEMRAHSRNWGLTKHRCSSPRRGLSRSPAAKALPTGPRRGSPGPTFLWMRCSLVAPLPTGPSPRMTILPSPLALHWKRPSFGTQFTPLRPSPRRRPRRQHCRADRGWSARPCPNPKVFRARTRNLPTPEPANGRLSNTSVIQPVKRTRRGFGNVGHLKTMMSLGLGRSLPTRNSEEPIFGP